MHATLVTSLLIVGHDNYKTCQKVQPVLISRHAQYVIVIAIENYRSTSLHTCQDRIIQLWTILMTVLCAEVGA